MEVSALEGQLSRTWNYQYREHGKKHVVVLFHDTITGVRSLSLDHSEVTGSVGNSSVLMESKGHRLFFAFEEEGEGEDGVDGGGRRKRKDINGFVEIKKVGWTGTH